MKSSIYGDDDEEEEEEEDDDDDDDDDGPGSLRDLPNQGSK